MKVLISTLGTRGDIQPFIALGKGLATTGCEVAVCTAEGFKPFVEGHGLRYASMSDDLLRLIRAPEGRAATEGARGIVALLGKVAPIIRRALEDEWAAARAFSPDAIVYHPKALGGYHIAEKLDIPAFMALPLPFSTPTSAFPNPFFSGVRLGPRVNRFTYRLMGLATAVHAGLTNDFRVATLGLPARGRFADPLVRANGAPVPVLYPYSRHVLPVPVDFPPHVHVTGYWFLERDPAWRPPPALARFLDDGPPPVYVGFGSMGGTDPARRTRLALEALERSGQRGLLASGWGGLAAVGVAERAVVIDEAPHDWLFPRVAAVVHHGGAGTTAAGLRAGKPTVICPFIADQPFWGRVVHDLGVGPRPIPQRKLTAAALAEAIARAVRDPALQRRAAALGERIHAEDGVTHAVGIIGNTLRGGPSSDAGARADPPRTSPTGAGTSTP